MKRPSLRAAARGFALPAAILMTVIVSAVLYLTLMQASNSLSLAYRESYASMARTASKSALDYAQEQFTANPTYNGTAETDLTVTPTYRVTYRIVVLSTSEDGTSKTVQGIGSVYLPKISDDARYASDMRSQVITIPKP